MSIPDELKYTRTHEWVREEGDTATIGITDNAQEELGDIVFVELPKVGDSIEASGVVGSIESVKAVSDVHAPVGGEVVEVNEALADKPELINEDPYGEGWIVKVRVWGEGDLLSADEYEKFTEEEGS
jgi:glycine cleavage system H protein